MHGARNDTERARGTSTTPPSAAHAARRTHVGRSRRVSTSDPEELHCSGTTPRAGTPQWPHTGGETTQALHIPRDAMPGPPILFLPPGHGLATPGCSSEAIGMTAS